MTGGRSSGWAVVVTCPRMFVAGTPQETLQCGQALEQAEKLFQTFHALVTHPEQVPDSMELGKMAVFAGVNEFPARVKCATLPWHTMKNAVENSGEEAKTE